MELLDFAGTYHIFLCILCMSSKCLLVMLAFTGTYRIFLCMLIKCLLVISIFAGTYRIFRCMKFYLIRNVLSLLSETVRYRQLSLGIQF